MNPIHLPQFVYYIGYGTVALIVVGLLILAILKWRNRRMFGGK
jgi:hypothetical protein